MDFSNHIPFPDKRLGGCADYDNESQIPMGLAVVCRNMRFRKESVRCRDGYLHTMSWTGGVATLQDCTGVEATDVLVNNPHQLVVASDSNGTLLQESPVGSGTLVPLVLPAPLPTANVSMQTAKAYNRIYMAFSDLVSALAGPLVIDGPTGAVTAISQNPIGALWAPGRSYIPGDVVRTSQNANRWFQCTNPGIAGPIEPSWPTLDGYFSSSEVGVVSFNPATASDPNGFSQWTEWSPWAGQYVPSPEACEQLFSIKGVAPGTIAAGQDVYVCFAYQNANGESAWTQPIVYVNTAITDNLQALFQLFGEVPGPIDDPPNLDYGGPRIPQWLASVIGKSDPSIQWPAVSVTVKGTGGGPQSHARGVASLGYNCLNVYVAAVPTGTPGPQTYYQYQSGISLAVQIQISSIPSTGTLFTPRQIPTAGLTSIPFIGADGPRYMAVERLDLNDSLVPIDPGSPILVDFSSSIAPSGVANIDFIQRSNNLVTCTVDQLAGFTQGAQAIIQNVGDSSFDGSFVLAGVAPNQWGGATLTWAQDGTDGGSTGGTATSASASASFVVPQILIATISRTSDVVTAVVNSLQGISQGSLIAVSGVSDPSFDGNNFAITGIVASNGGGGTLTWAQAVADSTGTGGNISPTGAGVGTNVSYLVGFIARGTYPADNATDVIGIIYDPSGQPTPPPPGFIPGASIVIQGMTDVTFNGTFTIRRVSINPGTHGGVGGGFSVHWTQAGAATKSNTPGGTLTLVSGASPIVSTGNITGITRTGGSVVATMDTVAGFVAGTSVQVNGVLDASFDGTFSLVAVNGLASTLSWNQPGVDSTSSGGTATQTSGVQQPVPVAVLPPGGQFISQDIAAFTVQGDPQQGPFFAIPEQDPVNGFTSSILSIGNVNGEVSALLKDASGFQAGDTVQVVGTPNNWFDGVFVLAQVNGNAVVYAGSGPGTGYSGGSMTLVPTLPTEQPGQSNPVTITSMARTAAGIVTAQIADVSNLEPGMRVSVTAPSPWSELVTLLTVVQNQLPGSTTPLAGVATWQSVTLSPGTLATASTLVGLPGILFNAIDSDLSNADDVTVELTSLGAPNCVDVYFCEGLNMMVYTLGQDSSHYFSNPGDPANIADPGGILGVAEANGQRTRCFKEIVSGELISLKERSGYAIAPGSTTPSGFGVSRRWQGHGPCGPRAADIGDDFLCYFDEDSGPYKYSNGRAEQVGQEKQGTWDRLNKLASAQVCVCVDNVRKEIHFLLPLDGATVPNHDLTLNYFNGWNEPLFLTLTGEMAPDPHGRRWSDNDPATGTVINEEFVGGSARIVKVIQRRLTNSPSNQTVKRQLVFGLVGTIPGIVNIDMSVPDQFTDNGAAIAQEYQPAFAQSPTCEQIYWDKFKGRALGAGMLTIQPLTEHPDKVIKPVQVDLTPEPVI